MLDAGCGTGLLVGSLLERSLEVFGIDRSPGMPAVARRDHVGDEHRNKTEGYGGQPMKLSVHRRPVDRMAGWLRDAGFTVEAEILLDPEDSVPGGITLAPRRV